MQLSTPVPIPDGTVPTAAGGDIARDTDEGSMDDTTGPRGEPPAHAPTVLPGGPPIACSTGPEDCVARPTGDAPREGIGFEAE